MLAGPGGRVHKPVPALVVIERGSVSNGKETKDTLQEPGRLARLSVFRTDTGKMQKGNRWILVFALFLTIWGQFTYACETMDMPPQTACCCEDGMAGCDTAVPPPSGNDCDHGGPTTSSSSCCEVDYQSAVENAAPTSLSADQALTWLYAIALVYWPYLDSLSTLSSTSPPPDPNWLLAQAESGRTVYLSTLRLRI